MKAKNKFYEAFDALDIMSETQKEINSACLELSKSTKVSKNTLHYYKHLRYHKGKGLLNDYVSTLDPDEKIKDVITPVFKRLINIVDTLSQVGHLSLLDEYLEDLRKYNIDINLTCKDSTEINSNALEAFYEKVEECQDIIYSTNEELDSLSVSAEVEDVCKKQNYKYLAKQSYAKNVKKKDNVNIILNNKQNDNKKYNSAIDIVVRDIETEV